MFGKCAVGAVLNTTRTPPAPLMRQMRGLNSIEMEIWRRLGRWNALAAASSGLTLELLPMMVGFFTYKGAMVARQSLRVFSDLVAEVKAGGQSGSREGTPQD